MKSNSTSKGYTVHYYNVDDLTPAIVQPDIRMKIDKSVKKISESMMRDGFWKSKPITITSDLSIADGHRRWLAAKLAGIKLVPCIIESKPIETLWAEQNDNIRKMGTRDLVQAIGKGLHILPSSPAGDKIQYVIDVYGRDMLDYMEENGMGISAIQWATSVVNFLDDADIDVSRVIHWMAETRTNLRNVRVGLEMGTRKEIGNCIREGIPLRMVGHIGRGRPSKGE